jgi:hypothetical protein
MSPGPLTSHNRGGFSPNRAAFVSPNRVFVPSNRSFAGSNRAFNGTRNRFAVGVDETGVSHVVLDDGEIAEIVANPDGGLTISVENKPAPREGNGEPAPAPMASEPISTGFFGRVAHGVLGKMSWVKEPGGEIVITPDEGETLFVTGDALQAVVTAQPTTPG